MASDDHIVRDLLAALDAGDIDTAVGFLTEDVILRDYRIHIGRQSRVRHANGLMGNLSPALSNSSGRVNNNRSLHGEDGYNHADHGPDRRHAARAVPVLIPLMIRVWLKAAGAAKRSEHSHDVTRRRPQGRSAKVRGNAMNNVVRMDDRRELA
jgi:hypothetical protein